jgi:dienelactone hydrolase
VKLALLVLALTPALVSAKLVTRTIDYADSHGTALEGYVVYDDAKAGPHPGVIVVHDWRGLTDYTKKRACMIAELGYVAFAADVYGKGVHPASVADYGKTAAIYKSDRSLFRDRLQAAYNAFLQQPELDKSRLAAIGYCFGGTGVVEMLRDGLPLQGAVTFHGGLDSRPVEPGKTITQTKLLALCGASDPFETADDMMNFQQQMQDAGVDLKVVEYPGAQHAFTDAGVDALNLPGAKYNAAADHESWAAMKMFLKKIFAPKKAAPAKLT